MKKIMSVIAAAVLCCNFAFAANTGSFEHTLNTQGLNQAVIEAMSQGNSIEAIMTQALAIQGMNPQAVIIALLNAGANVGAVATAATNRGVSAQVIAQATQQQASRSTTDTQAYTPAATATPVNLGVSGSSFTIASIPIAGVPGGGGGSAPAERYASPSLIRR